MREIGPQAIACAARGCKLREGREWIGSND
jgi:hypothetical protein